MLVQHRDRHGLFLTEGMQLGFQAGDLRSQRIRSSGLCGAFVEPKGGEGKQQSAPQQPGTASGGLAVALDLGSHLLASFRPSLGHLSSVHRGLTAN
jgi:hypothetical protein